MELWEQLLLAGMGLLMLFFLFPGIKATLERSRNAEERHWGTVLLLAVALIGFVLFLISSVQ